uniref:ThiF domain-containing protein n=1 Tax=Macrostomum lignano TaxID=282301 RepID=A0A1I8FDZ2_9PLAT
MRVRVPECSFISRCSFPLPRLGEIPIAWLPAGPCCSPVRGPVCQPESRPNGRERAVDLNLQAHGAGASLAATRCLLLGAGTLGCNVARLLMGWGVRNITPVPVHLRRLAAPAWRQIEKPKAAAKALIDIFPGVNAQWRSPCRATPYRANQEASVGQDVAQLESLVAEHDVVFLLLDSREARCCQLCWPPPLAAGDERRIGLDSYLVMRHGLGPGSRHGCYFCSTSRRPATPARIEPWTAACTVTRPGLAMIGRRPASGADVSRIAASRRSDSRSGQCRCRRRRRPATHGPGAAPDARFLSDASQMSPVGHRSTRCSAAPMPFWSRYRPGGYRGFLLKVFNDSSHLELVRGLAELHAEAELSVEVLEMDADDDDFLVPVFIL